MFCIHFLKDKWADVLIFNFGSVSYLLQARKCRFCRAAFFRHARAGSSLGADCGTLRKEDLERLGYFKETPNAQG